MSLNITNYYSNPIFMEFNLNFENLETKEKAIFILKNITVKTIFKKIEQEYLDKVDLNDNKFWSSYYNLYDFIKHFQINNIEENENYISIIAEYDEPIKYEIHETIPATYDSPEEPGYIEITDRLTKEKLEKDMETFLYYSDLKNICTSFELIDENLKSEDELLELISEDLFHESLEY